MSPENKSNTDTNMIRCVKDSREWVHVSYVVRSVWVPLIDSKGSYEKIKTLFSRSTQVHIRERIGRPMIELCASNTKSQTDSAVTYTYRVWHDMTVDDESVGSIEQRLRHLWGTIVVALLADYNGTEIVDLEITSLQKVDFDDSSH